MQGAGKEQLGRMTGVEYELDASARYLIRKQVRRSTSEVSVLAVYYVVGAGVQVGTVYALPAVHTVLSSQLCSATGYLELAVCALAKRIRFNPITYYTWSKEQDREEEDGVHKYTRLVEEVLRSTARTSLQ